MTGAWLLSGLYAPFAQAVSILDQYCQSVGLTLVLTSGYRSNEQQAELYAQGRTPEQIANHTHLRGSNGSVTDAWPGMSAHNWGLAVDLDSDSQDFEQCYAIAKQLGFGTVSWDPDHIEWPGWRSLAGV